MSICIGQRKFLLEWPTQNLEIEPENMRHCQAPPFSKLLLAENDHSFMQTSNCFNFSSKIKIHQMSVNEHNTNTQTSLRREALKYNSQYTFLYHI